MAISPYVRNLRTHVGPARLLLPSVSAHIFDAADRLLLVEQRDSGHWSTPGGMIEPGERPADAVVRETWEETGLLVAPTQVLGVYGGSEFVVRYSNGDEAQYVISAFGCEVVSGALGISSDETSAARYFSEAEAGSLPLAGWLRYLLGAVYARKPFDLPSWTPPVESTSRAVNGKT